MILIFRIIIIITFRDDFDILYNFKSVQFLVNTDQYQFNLKLKLKF